MSDPAAAAPVSASTDGAAPTTAAAPSGPSAELVRLQSRVSTHPQDFDAWVALVGEAERGRDTPTVRAATNGLLEQFPLCFGYWQRLAKLESSESGAVSADAATIERGLVAIPHSHELWTFYVTETMKNEQANPEDVRRSVRAERDRRTTRHSAESASGSGVAAGCDRAAAAMPHPFLLQLICCSAHRCTHAHARRLSRSTIGG